jgi:hypothetical protein
MPREQAQVEDQDDASEDTAPKAEAS